MRRKKARLRSRGAYRLAAVVVALVAAACATMAPERPKPGDVVVDRFDLPFSNLASPEARAIFARRLAEPPFVFGDNIGLARLHYGAFNDERLADMRRLFATKENHATWNGVDVVIVEPASGTAAENADRVLINIHGGAFMWGSGSGALVEAIPIAATGRIRVVTVDYRLAPEHRFPAASEDVAAVYRHLLEDYRPETIGLYGCSAGGIIAAQSVAWFQAHGLPKPGAVATLCGTAAPYGGDSVFLSAVGGGQPAPPASTAATRRSANPYLDAADLKDPLAFPEASDDVLRDFPPTLLLAGSRDFAASISTSLHRRFAALSVASELYLFDGLWHAFFMYPDMPESREAYGLIVQFFDRHLGESRWSVTSARGAPSPADQFGDLFEAVQSGRIFADSKTFADAVPKRPVASILADYDAVKPTGGALARFVEERFELPSSGNASDGSPAKRLPLQEHISALWPSLTRSALEPAAGSSALPLSNPYVVPGGRFREMYYWDSYFTMLGLKSDGRQDLVESMILDFAGLVKAYGHVPNGARSYYLSRSQPPFLALMIGLSEQRDPQSLASQLEAMQGEHGYWMAGAACAEASGACRRVVRMPDGALLNRYWDDRDTPRDESWAEDVATARSAIGRPAADVYRDLRAAAESGWDFSSRWLDDPAKLSSIHTTEFVPVDLNSLLWSLETTIASHCRVLNDAPCAAKFDRQAANRQEAMQVWLWDKQAGRFGDWDRRTQGLSPRISAATFYPLFVGLATASQAEAVASHADKRLIAPGGVRTTLVVTGQQWDRPNGWAPLQWIAIEGLTRYGETSLAKHIATGWINTVDRVYGETGKMLEKYNLDEKTPGGGGEYPLQDGFGWTNGVTRALLDRYPLPAAGR